MNVHSQHAYNGRCVEIKKNLKSIKNTSYMQDKNNGWTVQIFLSQVQQEVNKMHT